MKQRHSCPPFLPYFYNDRFNNYFINQKIESREPLLPSVKMYVQSLFKKWDKENIQSWVEPSMRLQSYSIDPIITWLGHSTVLIQISGLNIITDPIMANASFLFPRFSPGFSICDLPIIDVVLISHNHRDHMDFDTISALFKKDNPLFLVPTGNKKWFDDNKIDNVVELMWWDSYILKNNVTFSCTPAFHWSQRSFFDYNKALWSGWVIKSTNEKIYFAGDTAYEKNYFNAINYEFGPFDISLLPIGPCEPNEFMKRSHIGPEQAIKIFLDSDSKIMIPIHWGTFKFGIDNFDDPIKRLSSWWQKQDKKHQENRILQLQKIGETVSPILYKNPCLDTLDQNLQISSQQDLSF